MIVEGGIHTFELEVRTRDLEVTADVGIDLDRSRRLALSQSAVSHSLSRLRDLFGDTLFLRRPHGFEPTRRALELGPRVEELVRAASLAFGDDHAFEPAETDRQFVFSAPEYVASQIGGGHLVERERPARRPESAQVFHMVGLVIE